jgi:adenosine/AMP kinase
MELELVPIENPEGLNIILGMSHFIKTAEDLYEALVNTVPGAKFGLAFSEASSDRLIRTEGTDPALVDLAAINLQRIGAGHSFLILLRDSYPINFLTRLRDVPELVNVVCATSNAVQVVVARGEQGGGILGVIDGQGPLGIEDDAKRQWRRDFLRKIGYKL